MSRDRFEGSECRARQKEMKPEVNWGQMDEDREQLRADG